MTDEIPPQVWFGFEPFDPAKITPADRRSLHRKPHGLWTSSYLPDEPCLSDWGRWCHDERFAWPARHAALIHFEPARVLRISTIADLLYVTRADADSLMFEWRLDGFDAVWFDGRALHEAAFTPAVLPAWALAQSFDVESTVWLNPTIRSWSAVDVSEIPANNEGATL